MVRYDVALVVRRRGTACRVAVLLLCGLSPIAEASVVLAQDAAAAQSIDDHGLASIVAEASHRFHIPANWIRAVMHAESQHVDDVSSAGAIGLMQIMPDTWSALRSRYQLGANPFDPHDNIIAGAAYLREMLDRYGNVAATLAAYNAGPSRYDEYVATGRSLPAETRDYVAKLVPILGGEPLPKSTTIAPLPLTDWRDAPLFVTVASAASPAGRRQANGQSVAISVSASASDSEAPVAPTDGIFVSTSGQHRAP